MIPLKVPPALPAFLAVATTVVDPARLTALTPRIMQWADGVWLMDLSACRSYWQTNAQRLRMQPLALLREVLERTLSTPEAPVRAALADHPWPAVLVLGVMGARRLSGFMQLETPFAQALYRDIVWADWMGAAEVAATHFAAHKTVPFNGPNYRRQCKQLLAAARRLRLAGPWELRAAAAPSVRRRFGPTLAALWEWTFPESPTPDAQATAVAAFPWRRWEWAENPRVPRVLDHALWQWDAIAPLLCEDLDKLCRVRLESRGFEGRVTELAWKITLNDLREMPVVVRFRHPHDLTRELGHHKTAMLQAQYAFEAALKAHQRQDDNDIEVPIITWDLVLEACLSTPPVIADLFGALDVHGCEGARLLELENQLPVALAQFGLCQDWLPEASFIDDAARPAARPAAPRDPARRAPPATFWDAADEYPCALGARPEAVLSLLPSDQDAPIDQDFPWLAAARHRPLFLYANPEPLDTGGHSSGRVFIERTSTKWWRAATEQPEYRDYYRLLDRMQRSTWVFQNGAGQWFVHGVFA